MAAKRVALSVLLMVERKDLLLVVMLVALMVVSKAEQMVVLTALMRVGSLVT